MKGLLSVMLLAGLLTNQPCWGIEQLEKILRDPATRFLQLPNELREMILCLTPLHLACSKGSRKLVKSLLKNAQEAVHKNAQDLLGRTPFYLACQGGHHKVIALLLADGADYKKPSLAGLTPFFVACARGHTDSVTHLLAKGADTEVSCNGIKPWLIAARNRHTEVLKLLLPKVPSPNAHCSRRPRLRGDVWGSEFLLTAVTQGDAAAVHTLLDVGIDGNQIMSNACTPLFLAAERGDLDVVRVLLEAGIQPNKQDRFSRTALFIAALNNQLSVVETLISYKADKEMAGGSLPGKPLYMAEGGADWGTQGKTPLYVAAARGHKTIVRTLFAAGADAGAPLFIAAGKGYPQMVQLLLDVGVNKDVAPSGGCTPLLVAAGNGRLGVVEVLLRAGATVDKTDKFNRTPLSVAVMNGHVEVAQLLLACGADMEIAINYEISATAETAYPLRYAELFEVAGGAAWLDAVSSRDRLAADGATPLLLAVNKGHTRLVQLLLEAGANRSKTDKEGKMPVDKALACGQTKIVSLLLQQTNGANDEPAVPVSQSEIVEKREIASSDANPS